MPAPPGKDAGPKVALWAIEVRGRRQAVIGARRFGWMVARRATSAASVWAHQAAGADVTTEAGDAARYVAIITDGNGRWAKARDLPVGDGHQAGADTVKARLRDAVDLGVLELTVYSFSTENWSRPEEEV